LTRISRRLVTTLSITSCGGSVSEWPPLMDNGSHRLSAVQSSLIALYVLTVLRRTHQRPLASSSCPAADPSSAKCGNNRSDGTVALRELGPVSRLSSITFAAEPARLSLNQDSEGLGYDPKECIMRAWRLHDASHRSRCALHRLLSLIMHVPYQAWLEYEP
jgi:hypothetical protein